MIRKLSKEFMGREGTFYPVRKALLALLDIKYLTG